jgi:uncharacterized SAM-binding protein YcdF (DUF218 family)
MKKLTLLFSLIGAALAGAWLYGFLGFVDNVMSMRDPGVMAGLEPTDAIVVLTGGSERVSTGVELLKLGNGKKLFISGVYKNLSLESIFKPLAIPEKLRACCISLGYRANSTASNAEETRDWLKAEGYASVRLVTANYHIPRSLLLFHAAMQDITIVPHPITPDKVKIHEWWRHPGTIDLLATEYSKYLVAELELWLERKNQKQESPLPAPQPSSPVSL